MGVNLSLFAGAGWQFFDNNGVPLAGGLIYTYAAGTTTPQATYTSSAGTIAHANPIVLNSAGRVSAGEVWVSEGITYKFVLQDSTSTTIGTYDNINSSYVATSLANTSDPTLGDALVGFRQSNASGNLTGSVGRTVHQKFQEFISVLDFGADPTGTTECSSAINAAITAVSAAGGGTVFFPAGTYKITSAISQLSHVNLQGTGYGSIIDVQAAINGIQMFSGDTFGVVSCYIKGLNIKTSTNNGLRAIYVKDSVQHKTLENYITGFVTAAVVYDGTNTGNGCFCCDIILNKIIGGTATSGIGISIGVSTNINNNFNIQNNRIQGRGSYGIDIAGIFIAITIIGNDIEGNTSSEIHVAKGGSGLVISGNYSETNAIAGNWLQAKSASANTSTGWSITGNSINAAASSVASAIVFTSDVNPVLSGVSITGNSFIGWDTGNTLGVIAFPGSGVPANGVNINYNNFGSATLQTKNEYNSSIITAAYAASATNQAYIKMINTAPGANAWQFGVGPDVNSVTFRNTTNSYNAFQIINGGTVADLAFAGGASGALATNAIAGFPYIPTCPGTPTGTPSGVTGYAPMVVDSTNHKLYVYTGAAWVAMN
jgi:hypothetical protein